MEPRNRISKFNVRCSNIEVRSRSWDSNVDVWGQVLNFEIEVWTSMFDFLVKHGISKSDFNVRCPPPAITSHPLTCLNFFFLLFFLSFAYFFPRQTSKRNMKIPTSNKEVVTLKFGFKDQNSNFENGTSKNNFNVRCPPPRANNPLSFLFSCFFSFCLLFFYTPNLKSLPQCSNFNFEIEILQFGFKNQTWNLEHFWEKHCRAHPSVRPVVVCSLARMLTFLKIFSHVQRKS